MKGLHVNAANEVIENCSNCWVLQTDKCKEDNLNVVRIKVHAG